jgi:hypothetical protein
MIGLMFLGALIAWGLFAFWLGKNIPVWFKFKYPNIVTVVLVPVIFLLPVADEVIAYPQMQALCSNLQPLDYAAGMNAEKAFGRTVYYRDIKTPILLSPSTVKAYRHDGVYFDAKTEEQILSYHGYTPTSSWLAVPNGSSGGEMTLILRNCSGMKTDSKGYAIEKYGADGLPIRFAHLNLTKLQ